MLSDIRVSILTARGELDVTNQTLSVEVSDGLSLEAAPAGSITLPAKRSTGPNSRVSYWDLLEAGDIVTVEMCSWDGMRGGWHTVLHGPIEDISESLQVSGDRLEATLSLSLRGMSHIPARDTVAYWMWLGTQYAWAKLRADITPDEANSYPGQLAYTFMKKVAFHRSLYDFAGYGLEDWMHLDFGGLQAVGPFAMNFTMMEGPMLGIISSILDSPLQELYATTAPPEFQGPYRHTALKPPGTNRGATLLRWRAAPYPYADVNGRGVLGEWNLLPLHRIDEPMQVISGSQRRKGGQAVRNFFLTYPALSFADEFLLFSIGAAIANPGSIRRFGYAPLKARTHLILNDKVDRGTVEEFILRLAWRLAAQHNKLHLMASAQVQLPLLPWIRPGDRLEAPFHWNTAQRAQYHIRGRQMTWNPREGGRMNLAVERGQTVDIYHDPAWFVEGLEAVRIGSEVLTQLRR